MLPIRQHFSPGVISYSCAWFCAQKCRGEVPSSISSRGCWPNRSQFSVVFSKTCVNTGYDSLESSQWRAFLHSPKSHMRTIGLIPATTPPPLPITFTSSPHTYGIYFKLVNSNCMKFDWIWKKVKQPVSPPLLSF